MSLRRSWRTSSARLPRRHERYRDQAKHQDRRPRERQRPRSGPPRLGEGTRTGAPARQRLHHHLRRAAEAAVRPRGRCRRSPGRPRLPRAVPVHARRAQQSMYRGRLWTMRQFAGFGSGARDERALQVPARSRTNRALDGIRLPDADGATTRIDDRSLGEGRGRPGRRRGLVA